ncbi:hypothetical protein E2I00_007101, partial [Balaenoptera physalus]
THSLRYFHLGVSDPGYGIPEFISVGYVDSHPITMYDSKEPQAPWMAENLASDRWERYAQLLRGWRQTFKLELERQQRHYNHSGGEGSGDECFPMIGCELLEDGNTTGFPQYAYDGQDFIIFNKDTLSWMAMDNVVHITKRAWEAGWHELQYQKNWLEERIAWLKRFLEYGKGTLQRTAPTGQSKSQGNFPGIATLYCRAHGFYPPEISMIWMKKWGRNCPRNGLWRHPSHWGWDLSDMGSSDLYSCHVEHGGVHVVLQGSQESETMLLAMKAVGFIVLAIDLSGVGVVAWQRKP